MSEETIRFRRADLELFSAASHDRNPLHLSASYARTTPYGEPVVFGVLGALAIMSRLPDRRHGALASVSLDFRGPIFTEVDYCIEAVEKTPGQYKAAITDAGQVLLAATFAFSQGKVKDQVEVQTQRASATEPHKWKVDDLQAGLRVDGQYGPARGPFLKVLGQWRCLEKGATPSQIALLMWASYLVGMQLPGERASFSRLRLGFREGIATSDQPFVYTARVTEFDERFDLLQIESEIACGGFPFAEAQIWSFVRRDRSQWSQATLDKALPRSEALRGRVALVIGGSRGLGAGFVRALVSQACTVFLNYQRSQKEARALHDELRCQSGSITLVQGDGGDPRWCRKLRKKLEGQGGGLDILICNATPPIRPARFSLETSERARQFIDESLSLVITPMAACLDLVNARSGWNVLISSSFVHTSPSDWQHYVAAKCAAEGLVRSVAPQYPMTRFLIVRPPRLLTDQTNTPMGRQGAMPLEGVVARVILTLCGDGVDGDQVRMLEDFHSA